MVVDRTNADPAPGVLRRAWPAVQARLGGPLLEALLARGSLRRRLARSRSEAVEGQFVDEHLAAMLRIDDLSGDSLVERRTPEEARRALRVSVASVDAPPRTQVHWRELWWSGPGGSQRARLYTPPGLDTPSPAVVYFHGGGWVVGDLESHDFLCRRLAVSGHVRVVAIDYRLAPEHPFPAAAEDAVAAFRWCVEHARELEIDPACVAVAGDSAGGNLSAVVSLHSAAHAAKPALAVLLYPGLDATRSQPSHRALGDRWMLTEASIAWYHHNYYGDSAEVHRHPDASPVFATEFAGVCPTWICACHFDPLRDEAVHYSELLRKAGVDVKLSVLPTMIHGFALMTRASPAARGITERIAADLGAALRAGAGWRGLSP